ncbi:TetR/AcrR family transcriptional regulator [Mycolicibacterium sphagni]|uniref:TetR family transcriptional regulator n=1 Tax=Mycolicibacterium sphagni TaxID=1786 RepID=A0A255D9U8_9MYCO|nr:TetR/AcrR family transcriptional regulator [Mycolicibacterium sphagni]OYN76199.1 TetR family transcriptional regulator [Mycolicibacterium sphagni]
MSGQHSEDTPTHNPRPRGRPRTVIDLDAVADAVAELVIDGGENAISIVGAAERLDISRATLYRLVPTKEDLVGIMFERATRQQTEVLSEVVESGIPVRDRLIRLIRMQVETAIRLRGYMPIFFGSDGLPADVFQRWHAWSREFEATWHDCVEDAMAEGVLEQADVGTTTRLVLGMCLWVSRWYRAEDGIGTEHIARVALSLILPEGS